MTLMKAFMKWLFIFSILSLDAILIIYYYLYELLNLKYYILAYNQRYTIIIVY